VRHQRVRDAKEDLWLALAAGEIQATAVHGADGPVILIEQVEWHHLRPFQTLNADYLSYEHGPGGVAYTRVKFLRPQIVKRWPVSAVTEGKPESPVATPRNPGGRPRAYNWDEVMHECVRLANLPDGLPERPQLVEHLQHWFLDRYESEPAVSVIYERIAPLYKHVGDNRKSSK
jgi:hypothetical protein